jgi:hypothetical protein
MPKIEHEEIRATLRIAMDQFDAVRDRLESFSTADLQVLTATHVALSSDTAPAANTWRAYVQTWVARHILEQRERARELKHIRDTNNAKFDSWNRRFDHTWRQDNWN